MYNRFLVLPLICMSVATVTCTISYYGTENGAALSGILPGYQQLQRDEFSPLTVETVAPNPVPVYGSDKKFHVAYELLVQNASPRAATIAKMETLANDENGAVVSTLSHGDIVAHSMLTANYPAKPTPVTSIPPGRTLILILEDVYGTRESVPSSVTHRIFATFDPPAADQSDIAKKYPNEATLVGGLVSVSADAPVVIGPPLVGDGWLAGNGCCAEVNAHRGVILPVGGRFNGGERFAIDWVVLDLSKENLVVDSGAASYIGDPTKNESYLAFGKPVIAVADGTIVTAINDMPDVTPRVFAPGLLLSELGGNYVVMQISDGVYAFYAHMKKGSVSVKAGDRVIKGQVIGLVGNSGNTSEAHLHFHLMRSPLPLTADQVPWVIDNFNLTGTVTGAGSLDRSLAGPSVKMLPLDNTVSSFPAKL